MKVFKILSCCIILSFVSFVGYNSYVYEYYADYRSAIGDLKTSRTVASAKNKFLKYAEQGHKDSRYYLGMMYAAGLGVEKDEVQAEFWLSCPALDKTCVSGQYEHQLSVYFASGYLVNESASQSAYWLKKAEEKGYKPVKQ